jgi:predicted amino acid-binding ACT domain protein
VADTNETGQPGPTPSSSATSTTPTAKTIEQLAQEFPAVDALLDKLVNEKRLTTIMIAEIKLAKVEIQSLKEQIDRLKGELGRTIAVLDLHITGTSKVPFRNKHEYRPTPPPKQGEQVDLYR